MVLGHRSGAQQMNQYAFWYPATADLKEAIVQDFHSFRQALNVASADQRVLVLVNAPTSGEQDLRASLRGVANDEQIIGRFHFDFEQGDDWKKNIEGTNDEPGIVLIHPGEFGMSGKVIRQLPLHADGSQIISAMIDANTHFAATTTKKVYSEHVAKGRSAGIYFEGAVPYGEDRDGDGQIDRGRDDPPAPRSRGP